MSGRHPPRLPAALYPRAAAGRDPLDPVDEPLADEHFDTLADLDAVVAERCVALGKDRDLLRGQTDFDRGPKRIRAN